MGGVLETTSRSRKHELSSKPCAPSCGIGALGRLAPHWAWGVVALAREDRHSQEVRTGWSHERRRPKSWMPFHRLRRRLALQGAIT